MSPWWYVGGAVLVVLGVFVLAVVCCSAKLAGPDTDQRDPYQLADRPSDAPTVDLDLAVVRADAGVRTFCCYCGIEASRDHLDWCPRTGVDVALDGPDGSHDVLPDLNPVQWAAEPMWLYEMYPDAVALDQGDDVLGPAVIPGREETS